MFRTAKKPEQQPDNTLTKDELIARTTNRTELLNERIRKWKLLQHLCPDVYDFIIEANAPFCSLEGKFESGRLMPKHEFKKGLGINIAESIDLFLCQGFYIKA